MALSDLLAPPIAYHRVFRTITGNTVAAIMLSQALYWQRIVDKGKGGKNGWWFKSAAEWEKELGLSRSEQETARKVLSANGLLETERRGVPATIWYHLSLEVLDKKLEEYQQNAEFPQTRNFRKQVCRDSAGKFAGVRQTISKTTSKITPETTPPPPPFSVPEQQEEVGEYIQRETDRAAAVGEIRTTRQRYAAAVRKNIKSEGGRLTPERREQLEQWRSLPTAHSTISVIAPDALGEAKGLAEIQDHEIRARTLARLPPWEQEIVRTREYLKKTCSE